jgi:hypothetical protein
MAKTPLPLGAILGRAWVKQLMARLGGSASRAGLSERADPAKSWERVEDGASAIAWLEARTPHDGGTGLDAHGWESHTWVLHAMYEHRDLRTTYTHQDVHQDELERGLVERTVINGVDLDAMGVATGIPLGWIEHPGRGWTRLYWRGLAAREGIRLGDSPNPPSDRWFPYRSWPASISPPPEESLDPESFERLAACLREQDPRGPRPHASRTTRRCGWRSSMRSRSSTGRWASLVC